MYDDHDKVDKYSDILITKRNTQEYLRQNGLKKTLTSGHIWGIGVGTVITGQFLGWNNGLGQAGPLGFILITLAVSLFYLLFVMVLSKLSAVYPYSGGAYAYARKGIGKFWGFIAGFSTMVEFICVASVIFAYIGLYINTLVSQVFPIFGAFLIFAVLIVIQLTGIKESSMFQLIMTGICVSTFLLFFMGISSSAQLEGIFSSSLPNGVTGVITSIPFALWFFIGIDVIAISAEEAKNPSQSISLSFFVSLFTIIFLSLGVIWFSVRSIDWALIAKADFPLTFILGELQKNDKVLLSVFAFFSLSSFIASLNGIIMGYSRQVFSLSRAGYLPEFMSKVFSINKAPYFAVIVPSIIVLLLAEFANTALMIIIACFCAVISYILVLISNIKITVLNKSLKKSINSQNLYVYIALLMTFGFITALVVFESIAALITAVVYAFAAVYYFILVKNSINNDAPEEVEANTDEINKIITNM